MVPCGVLVVSVLGPVALLVDGEPVRQLRSRGTTSVLLALLLSRPSPAPRAELAALLWPDAGPAAARAELSRLLHGARRALGPALEADARSIWLVPGEVSSDLDDLQAAVESTEPRVWRGAVERAGGLFLADASRVLDRPEDDDLRAWLQQQRQLRHGQLTDLLARLADDAVGQGDAAGARHWARRWAAHDPADPAARQLLARLDTSTGGRGAAADPPRSTHPLLGRDGLVDRVLAALRVPDTRVLTLVGPGGVGKTRLAVEVARRAARAQDGASVVWSDLTAVTRADRVLESVAAGLRAASGNDTGADPHGAVVRALRGAPALLVLDNLEQLVDDGVGRVLADLLADLPELTVLATSRGRLRLRGEQLVEVPPLELPVARALFGARVRDAGSSVPSPDDGGDPADEVCRQLDGLPLAVELAAAQVRLVGVDGLRDLLTADRDLHATEDDGRPERHRTLRRAVLWGADLLPGPEREAFARFGVFAGAVTREGVAVVAPPGVHPLALVGALVDAGLLVAEPAGRLDNGALAAQRFRMLATVAAVAREELARSGREAQVRDAHLRWLTRRAAAAAQWGTDATGCDQAGRWAELHRDVADLRAALEHAAQGPVEELADLVWVLEDFWRTRRYAGEGLSWARRVLDRGAELDPERRARAGILLGHLSAAVGAPADMPGAFARAGAAVEEMPASPDRDLLRARVLIGLAGATLFRGDLAEGDASSRAAGDLLARVPADGREVADRLHGLIAGTLAMVRGDVVELGRVLDASWPVSRTNAVARPAYDFGRGMHLLQTGDPSGALGWFADTMAGSHLVQERSALRSALHMAAAAALAAGDPVAAAQLLGAADADAARTDEAHPLDLLTVRDTVLAGVEAELGGPRTDRERATGEFLTAAEVEQLTRAAGRSRAAA